MSEIRILNLYHKKSILVDIYRQSLLIISVKGYNSTIMSTLSLMIIVGMLSTPEAL